MPDADWKERLKFTRLAVPKLDQLSDHERVGRLFLGEYCHVGGLPEVLAELVPEQREFWLRVQAEIEHRFRGFMTAVLVDDVMPQGDQDKCCDGFSESDAPQFHSPEKTRG